MAQNNDEPTVPNYRSLEEIKYVFDRHCRDKTFPNIHRSLITGLSETIEDDVDDLFLDDDREELVDFALDTLRDAIVFQITQEAKETTKPERIAPIIKTVSARF